MSNPWQRLSAMLKMTTLPAILLEPPSGVIVAASAAAAKTLGHGEPELIGRSIEDFITGRPSGGLSLLAQGTVSAYETRRQLLSTGDTVHLWIRSLPATTPPGALVVMIVEHANSLAMQMPPPAGNIVAIGSIDQRMVIERLTPDIAGMIRFNPNELIGTSLLQLIDPADASRIMELSACTAPDRTGDARPMRVRLSRGINSRCEILLVPNVPDGGYAFTIVAVGNDPDNAERALRASLGLLPTEAHTSFATGPPAGVINATAFTHLARREFEVVTELLAGNRVPAIARKLYLTQGTVRNYLSTAYRKLGVRNQQELIDLLRQPAPWTRKE